MAVQPLLPFPPQPGEDSASNRGSSVAGDFDDALSSDQSRASPPITGSPAEDSDDEACSWVTPADLAILRAINCRLACNVSTRDGNRPKSNMYHQVSRLPKGTKPVRLVGEGAANAVFEIKVPPNGRAGTPFKGKLLRVAKVPTLGHAPTSNYLVQQQFFHTVIEPRLGDYAVHQELVVLHNSGVVDELNAMLQDVAHSRKPKFRGSFVGQARWGFLVEDMRPAEGSQSVLVEFKPKWLLQSPSAPGNAIRCRQCALELRNCLLSPDAKKSCPESKPCPLALGTLNSPKQVSSPFRIAPQLAGGNHFQAALKKVVNHKAIHVLRAQQKVLDQTGPLNTSFTDTNFVVAMTLRDCTCFALIPADEKEHIKLRLGDFDWKDPEAKFSHWRGTEQDLIDGGFYTADWIVCNGTYYHPPSLCLLEWLSGKRTGGPKLLLLQEKLSGEEVESLESTALTLRLESRATVYTHKTDIKALDKGLKRFEKEPAGTLPDALYNPFRCDPP